MKDERSFFKRKKKTIIFVAALLVIVLIVVINMRAQRETTLKVTVEKVKRQNLTSINSASGEIKPKKSVNISAHVPGRIDKIGVKEGDRVKAGDFLLKLDSAQYEANADRDRALIRFYKTELESSEARQEKDKEYFQNQKKLYDENLVSKEQLDTAKVQYDMSAAGYRSVEQQIEQSRSNARAADAQVEAARAQRAQALSAQADLIVRSPIDGVVTVRAVEPGAVVAPGRILLSIIDPNAVYMRGFVSEGEIGRVRVGQHANVFLDSAPNDALAGHVASIDAEASFTPENVYFKNDRVRQVFGVRIDLEHPAGFAKPGMPVDGTILLDR